jgi:putative Mg2+ transporter-C (MgtC) family protein
LFAVEASSIIVFMPIIPDLPLTETVVRVFLAVVLGSIVGIERELTAKSAGLRTHILVCLGSTVFMLVSTANLLASGGGLVHSDPSRIAAQVVTGIGFIGGGTVLRHGSNVRGLTTAASLWVMAAIGMLVGIGHYRLSCIVTLVTFLVLFTIGNLERYVFGKHIRSLNRLQLRVHVHGAQAQDMQRWLTQQFGKDMLSFSNKHQPLGTSPSLNTAQPGQPQPAPDVSVWLQMTVGVTRPQLDVTELSNTMNALPGVLATELRVYHADDE